VAGRQQHFLLLRGRPANPRIERRSGNIAFTVRIGRGATWRAELGLPEPSPQVADAIESLGRVARAAEALTAPSPFDALLTAASEEPRGEGALDKVVRRALLSMLEERRTRQPSETIETR
jgi:hypothetical protein